MGIKIARLSHSTDKWRPWGAGSVEVLGTESGITIEFTRKVGRGSSTFQIKFDCDSLDELTAAIEASQQAAKRRSS